MLEPRETRPRLADTFEAGRLRDLRRLPLTPRRLMRPVDAAEWFALALIVLALALALLGAVVTS